MVSLKYGEDDLSMYQKAHRYEWNAPLCALLLRKTQKLCWSTAMILLFCDAGLSLFQYGLRNPFVIITLIIEVIFIVLGVFYGLSTYKAKHIGMLFSALIGCLIFVYINTAGKKTLSDASIWLPLLAENLIVFAVISCVFSLIKKLRGT